MPTSLITTGLPQTASGLPEQEARRLTPIYMAINALADKVSAATGQVQYSQAEMAQLNQAQSLLAGNANKIYLKATATIAYGKLCHILLDGGKLSAELADSTNNTKPAQCVCNAPLGLTAGQYGEFILSDGYTQGIAGTTIGLTYYLGVTGNSQAARPAAAGTIIQAVGFGLGSLGFYLRISSLFIQN